MSSHKKLFKNFGRIAAHLILSLNFALAAHSTLMASGSSSPRPSSIDLSARVLYDQAASHTWNIDLGATEERKNFGMGGPAAVLQAGVIINILPELAYYGSPEPAIELFAEFSAIRTSVSGLFFTGAAAAVRVFYGGLYIGYGYANQNGSFDSGGTQRRLKSGTAAMLGCFVDYPITKLMGLYVGVNLYDSNLINSSSSESWDRLSVRGGVSFRR